MNKSDAISVVATLRAEVVSIVGVCGKGTHPLTELLDKLEKGKVRPEDAVEEAMKIRHRTSEYL